jgi:hypothetical protein
MYSAFWGTEDRQAMLQTHCWFYVIDGLSFLENRILFSPSQYFSVEKSYA